MKRIDPTNTQTAAEVEKYYRNVSPGDVAVIRCTHGGFLEFLVDVVTATKPRIGRVYLKQGEAWGGTAYYAKSGKSCWAPGGQANLVVPTPEVLAWAAERKMPIRTFDAESISLPPGQRDGKSGLSFTLRRAEAVATEKKRARDRS
jgi:hypothetical protein